MLGSSRLLMSVPGFNVQRACVDELRILQLAVARFHAASPHIMSA